jgi:SAM-dependent methyltransferase
MSRDTRTTPPESPAPRDEPAAVAERYARRVVGDRYSVLRPQVWQTLQERQRAMLRLFASLGWQDLSTRRLLEVGCGSGGNLLEMLRLGFRPEHLTGIELLGERAAQARQVLPAALVLLEGDALRAPVEPASQEALAARMWSWVKPGGGVLWYDFTVDNPRNPDVRGVPLARVRALFPQGTLRARRVTLAPPLARAVVRLHPALYTLFNGLPALRTHVLGWIAKA